MKKLKVLHVIVAPATGGAEVYVKDLVLNSASNGIKPFLLFTAQAKEIGRCEMFEKKFLNELKNNGVEFFFLPQGSKRNVVKGALALNKLLKLIKPDIVHSHLLTGVVHKLLSLSKIPLIYTHHNSIIKNNARLFSFLLNSCDGFIGISKICSDNLHKYLIANKKLVTIFNAVDEKRLKSTDKKVLDKNQINLLAVGRLTQQKNYPLMLNVIKELKASTLQKFHLNIAGEGDKQSELIELVKDLELADTVTLLGNRSDISQLMSESDLFIMSSDWEGLPIALIESQLLGLPAIVTDVGGCCEVIAQTGGGILTPKGDVAKFVQSITSLFNETVRLEFSEKAKRNATCYEINAAVELHKKYYESFVSIN
jgi:glycosyltransferase involved in cell wall biosynthesis